MPVCGRDYLTIRMQMFHTDHFLTIIFYLWPSNSFSFSQKNIVLSTSKSKKGGGGESLIFIFLVNYFSQQKIKVVCEENLHRWKEATCLHMFVYICLPSSILKKALKTQSSLWNNSTSAGLMLKVMMKVSIFITQFYSNKIHKFLKTWTYSGKLNPYVSG